MRNRFARKAVPFAERMRRAKEKALSIESRRCPNCGKLCRTVNGNPGTRDKCQNCGY